jgi:hypothetical protein
MDYKNELLNFSHKGQISVYKAIEICQKLELKYQVYLKSLEALECLPGKQFQSYFIKSMFYIML